MDTAVIGRADRRRACRRWWDVQIKATKPASRQPKPATQPHSDAGKGPVPPTFVLDRFRILSLPRLLPCFGAPRLAPLLVPSMCSFSAPPVSPPAGVTGAAISDMTAARLPPRDFSPRWLADRLGPSAAGFQRGDPHDSPAYAPITAPLALIRSPAARRGGMRGALCTDPWRWGSEDPPPTPQGGDSAMATLAALCRLARRLQRPFSVKASYPSGGNPS